MSKHHPSEQIRPPAPALKTSPSATPPPNQRAHHDPHEFVTMSFRVYGLHSDMIHRAAALKPGRSTASYMRQIVCEWAASDLGEPVPDYTALTRGPTVLAEAAAAIGMNAKEFAEYAVRALAAEIIDKKRRSEPPPAAAPTASSSSGTQFKAVGRPPGR